MLRLVQIDLRQNAVWLMPFFVLLAISEFAVSYPGRFGICFAAGFQFGFFMVLVYFVRGAYYRSDMLYLTLPINRIDFVSAKYVTAAILFFGPPIYGLVFWDLLGFFLAGQRLSSHQVDNGYALAHSMLARLAGSWIALAVILPIVLRWGSLLRITVMWILLAIVTSGNVYYFLRYSTTHAARFGMDGWILIVVLVLLTIGLLSFKLSAWLFQHKEV
jgi:hypothetical protein